MVTYVYTDAGKTAIKSSDGKTIPAQQGNRDYDALIASGDEILDYAPSIEDQLAAIEAKYAPRIAALREGIMSAYLTDGAIMDDNVSGLRTEWAAVIAQRNAEMEALLI